ncbi:hypothetical protein XTPLMG728_2541 [Xanthomonas translucens pv. poae]|uniref:Uncharacterized protein n=1 Tax=Xanthomonas graminis pv. poae TaxID=227946 RepID=A0A0K2ZZ71_9XANT|nr:hypothetical protein XTPLMG728_2541 [Xanthomonas translucens pv. poae]
MNRGRRGPQRRRGPLPAQCASGRWISATSPPGDSATAPRWSCARPGATSGSSARDQAFVLQAAQGLGQHALRDIARRTGALSGATRASLAARGVHPRRHHAQRLHQPPRMGRPQGRPRRMDAALLRCLRLFGQLAHLSAVPAIAESRVPQDRVQRFGNRTTLSIQSSDTHWTNARGGPHLPMQKLEKIRPSKSSALRWPTISPSAACARRSSSAASSSRS